MMSSVFQKTNKYVPIISDIAFKYLPNPKTSIGVLLCKIATNHYNKASLFVKINHFRLGHKLQKKIHWVIGELKSTQIPSELSWHSFRTKFVNFVHCASSCTVSNSKQNKKCVSPILSSFGMQHSGPGIWILSTNSPKTAI